jgi:hypothetical protein
MLKFRNRILYSLRGFAAFLGDSFAFIRESSNGTTENGLYLPTALVDNPAPVVEDATASPFDSFGKAIIGTASGTGTGVSAT